MYATAVLVRKTYGNGAATKVFAVDTLDGGHQVWADLTQPNPTVNSTATLPKARCQVKSARIMVGPNHGIGTHEEIGAVQLHRPESVPRRHPNGRPPYNRTRSSR